MPRKSAYARKLNDPRWQKVRLQVMQRDGWECRRCGHVKPLQVHHGYYQFGLEPWEYPLDSLSSLCEECHEIADQARETIKMLAGCLEIVDQVRVSRILTAVSAMGDCSELLQRMIVLCEGAK